VRPASTTTWKEEVLNLEAFRSDLEERGLAAEAIDASVKMADAFESWRAPRSRGASELSGGELARAFSETMIDRGLNLWDNYVALLRYARFLEDNEMYVAVMELIDGAEALETLHQRVAEELGEALRTAIFAGVELPPLGTPNDAKPPLMRTVIERLVERTSPEVCRGILGRGLRYLEDAWYAEERTRYEEAGGIDAYLDRKAQLFLEELRRHRDEGTLFFTQPITDEVIDYVRAHREVEAGIRDGSVILEAKIPHQAVSYLHASDPTERAFHYCHCPWIKASLRSDEARTPPVFCNCSAAFHKKPYEVIFGTPVRAEVVESVLAGAPWCLFAIHLPDHAR
jgi:hypothetical protein